MIKVKQITSIACCMVAMGAQAAQPSTLGFAVNDTVNAAVAMSALPAEWSLQDCIDYALSNNINIKKGRVNASSTDVDLLTAKAALFPSLSFSTSHNVVNRPFQETSSYVSGSEILQNSGKTSYNGNYGLNAQWTLYNGGKRLNTIKQEKLNSKAAQLDVETSENSIQESILQNYVQILYAAEAIKVNESTLSVSKAQYERGKQLVAAGSLSRVELAQLEAQVSTDEYQLVTAQTALQNYKLQLKQLLELDGAEEMNVQIVEIDDASVLATLPDKLDVYEAALAQRPEIQSGKLNIESAALGVKVAKAGYIPTIGLTAGIGTNHTTGSDFTFSEQVKNGWNNTAGLSVSVPIFNNRQTKSAVQKAKLQQETSQLDLQDKQKALYKSIEGYWLEAVNSQQRYAAAEKKQQSAQTSFELVSQQFDLGMKNIVELLTEKNTLLSARQETLQAKYMAVLNAQLLKFYQGEKVEL
jgi:outer membrane protein